MVNDYERQDFWKSNIKIKITKCDNEKSWYKNNVGMYFEINYETVRDYYVIHDGVLKVILKIDAEKE